MKKLLALGVLFLTTLVLASCSQSGLEKISFKEAEKKIKDTKGEYIAFIDSDDEDLKSYKKVLKKVAENQKIYYVELSDDVTTSEHYQSQFTKKYPNTKSGIFITNNGKEIKDNKIFEFDTNTSINSYRQSNSDIDEAIKEVNKFLDREG